MNVLFLTIGRFESIEAHSIYPDLLRCFRDNGHTVYIVSPREKRYGLSTEYTKNHGTNQLFVRVGNITKCGIVEKGISTILIESQYKAAIIKYLQNVKFDLILYSTPPITLTGIIDYIKNRDQARTYLMLKDIFPQNAVDLGLMRTTGMKGLLYKYFRRKEKRLYSISDKIGCMSQANVEYILKHNSEIDKEKVEICPNSIAIQNICLSEEAIVFMRQKYDIPLDKKVFVYGGNLGKPQGIPFVIDCLMAEKNNQDAYFLIVGDGTEYAKLEAFINNEKPTNVKLMKRLPKDDYDRMIAACDVGLIFLDHRFTIPNFPSRLLAYMQAGLPVLACTDTATDIGQVITNGGFGWWCESNDKEAFLKCTTDILTSDIERMRDNELDYLKKNYSINKTFKIIIEE